MHKPALTFDDVLLVPGRSDVLPKDVDISTRLCRGLNLKIPFVSAAMDTVSESAMAIAMAQAGGIAIIHKNMARSAQVEQVRRVKKFESGIVVNPVTIHPDQSLGEAIELTRRHGISGIPVVNDNRRLVGILTNRDMRFAQHLDSPVHHLMTKDNLITVREDIDRDEAKKILHTHRIEKLLVVDDKRRCIGLITVKDIEKAELYPDACKDSKGHLRVGAAIGVEGKGNNGQLSRAKSLIEAGVDVLVIDTAHGHTLGVLHTLERVKALSAIPIIAGNIATPQAAMDLIKAGADAVKVGIGPGSICTTRIVAGVGVPQFSAVCEIASVCRQHDIPLISDGGVRYSGDAAKALAGGADCIMIGSLLAGTDESPGDVFLYQGRPYKSYRGMGSVDAMKLGSASRYFQSDADDSSKLIPEGVEGQVPYKGSTRSVLYQLVGGVRSAMGYIGAPTITDMQNKATFRQITTAGMQESHVHDVTITRESPNYHPSNV